MLEFEFHSVMDRVFESRLVYPIWALSSGMGPGRSVQISSLESALLGLIGARVYIHTFRLFLIFFFFPHYFESKEGKFNNKKFTCQLNNKT